MAVRRYTGGLKIVFALAVAQAEKLRVLFVGNSFTFVNDLPGQLANIAASLGDEVEAKQSTIGGCTILAQQSILDVKTTVLLQEDWDYIVVQDYSILPTVKKAREVYLYPGVQGLVRRKKLAKVVMYMTWGYHDGLQESCPGSGFPLCFPRGYLADLTEKNCTVSGDYQAKVGSFECMGYSLARGYFDAMTVGGADMVAPCGLAWQVARGSSSIPAECKASVDAEYESSLPVDLPFQVPGGTSKDTMLNLRVDGNIDKHQNRAGCYLNALVFYATLFGKLPIGAAAPLLTNPVESSSWGLPQPNVSATEVEALQRAAAGTVVKCGPACGADNKMIV